MKTSIFFILLLVTSSSFGARITGILPFLQNGDSVCIGVDSKGLKDFDASSISNYSTIAQGQSFDLNFPMKEKIAYTSITFFRNGKRIYDPITNSVNAGFYDFLIEPDDNINISVKNKAYIFSGTGADKWNIQQDCESAIERVYTALPAIFNNANDYVHTITTCYSRLDRLIKDNRSFISNLAFQILQCDMASRCNYELYMCIVDPWTLNDNLSASLPNILHIIRNELSEKNKVTIVSNYNWILSRSRWYYRSIIAKYQVDSFVTRNADKVDWATFYDLPKSYQYYSKNFKGELREKLLLSLFLYHLHSVSQAKYLTSYIDSSKLHFKYDALYDELMKIGSTKVPGKLAYNFCLPDAMGKYHTLREYKDYIVILDFWFTGCGNCAEQHPIVDSVYRMFGNSRVKIISINNDLSQDIWKKSIKLDKYTETDYVNLCSAGRFSGVLSEYNIHSFPTLLLINKSGIVMQTPEDPRHDKGVSLFSLIKQAL